MLLSEIAEVKNGRIITIDSLPEADFQGIKIAIENKEGSIRKGQDENGEPYKAKMFYPYGYIKNTEGTDGDEIDCFVGPEKDAKNVFIIHSQIDGEFDEDKIMLGYTDELHARDAFLAHYQDDSHLGPITRMSMEDFKQAIKNHKRGTTIDWIHPNRPRAGGGKAGKNITEKLSQLEEIKDKYVAQGYSKEESYRKAKEEMIAKGTWDSTTSSERAKWNGPYKGRRVRYNTSSKDWNGREGTVVGCLRGDMDAGVPWVSVMFDTKGDGTKMTSHVLWEAPSNRLELI